MALTLYQFMRRSNIERVVLRVVRTGSFSQSEIEVLTIWTASQWLGRRRRSISDATAKARSKRAEQIFFWQLSYDDDCRL